MGGLEQLPPPINAATFNNWKVQHCNIDWGGRCSSPRMERPGLDIGNWTCVSSLTFECLVAIVEMQEHLNNHNNMRHS